MKNKANRKRRRSRDQVAALWGKQAAWLVNTITMLHESPTGHGLKWTAKMIAHYKKQYDEMRKRTPKLCAHQASVYDSDINAIIDHYSEYL